MRVVDCEQGSVEFFRARMGIPTASNFSKIVTPVTGKLSKSSKVYAYQLVVERLLNRPMETIVETEWMSRGRELEAQAVREYEFINEISTERVGFIVTDDGLIGASPDRLLKGRSACLEVKVPAPHTHLGYLLDGNPIEHRPQCQGQLYVTDFEFCDFFSHNERMPPCLIRTHRDEAYICLLRDALDEFNERLFDLVERARSLGLYQAYEEAVTPLDVERADELRDAFGSEAQP